MKRIAPIVVVLLALAAPTAAQIPLDRVHVVNSPNVLNSPNVPSWPVTTQITRLELRPTGVHVEFDRQASWPDVTPPGWGGPLQYTLWLFLQIGDEWYTSGIIQFWRGLTENGGDVTTDNQIARNWVYDKRWSAMVGHQPAPGERVGFMVSAGNARGQDDHLVMERSNVVEIAFPRTPTAFPPFTWIEGTLVPAPQPVPTPPSPPPTPAPPVFDATALYAQLATLNAKMDDHVRADGDAHAAIDQNVTDGRVENRSAWAKVAAHWKEVVVVAGPVASWFVAKATGGKP